MIKNEILNKLESYIFDYQYFLEKSKDIDNVKREVDKIIRRLNDMKLKNFETFEIEEDLNALNKRVSKEENILSKLITEKEIVEDRVEALPQPYKNILFLKYIKGNSFDEIARKMHYSTKRIYQLHKEGIQIYIEKAEQITIPEISKS